VAADRMLQRHAAVVWAGVIAYIICVPLMMIKGLLVVGNKIQLSDVVFLAPLMAWASGLRAGAWRFVGTPLLRPLSVLVGVAVASTLAWGAASWA